MPVFAVDGKKWDGKKYPFSLLDPSKPNSETNPFIIDTAGKLAFFGDLAKADVDMVAYGKTHGLPGLNWAFKDNYLKLTADLDMNGSQFEFVSIPSNSANFDGGGHVLSNVRISDKTTPPFIDPDTHTAEMHLGLFQDINSIKNLGIGKGSSITYYGVSKSTLMVFAGSLAANAYKIDNCFSEAAVTVTGNGEAMVAGLAAQCTLLSNSCNQGAVSFEGNVIDSRAKNWGGTVFPSWLKVGGVCAQSNTDMNGCYMTGCYNTGAITVRASGNDIQIGGVSADANNVTCADLYNTGAIRVVATGDMKDASIGGVLGHNFTYPSNPKYRTEGYIDSGYIYNKGRVDVSLATGQTVNVGGVGGGLYSTQCRFAYSSVEFSGVYGFINTYNAGDVSVSSTGKATINVGGIAGTGAMIINSYNTGKISGSSGPGATLNTGGLGGSDVYVQNSYNRGQVTGKGTGTNCVGGLIGRASVAWGESDRAWYSALNGFWLKQSTAGGVNNDVKYAKGSYFYLKKSEIQKEGLGIVLDALGATGSKNDNPDGMVEDSFPGFVYSFDSPSASIMKRTDDGPGKRADLNATLLASLNKMAAEKVDRLYRKWLIDGTNGGYPILSAVPTVFNKNAETPSAAAALEVAGEYAGVHKSWKDTVFVSADGTFKRATGSDGGTWSYDGTQLILKWKKWPPEILQQTAAGSFSCGAYKFTLNRAAPATPATAATPATPATPAATLPAAAAPAPATPAAATPAMPAATSKQVEAIVKNVSGTYYAQHKNWTGNLTINADGTFVRNGTGDGGTWTSDGRTLVLAWKTSAPETLQTSVAGFYCPSYKFTLRKF